MVSLMLQSLCFMLVCFALRSATACSEESITRCACTEILLMTELESGTVDGEDIKQGFRAASKLYHPDSRGPSKSADAFAFLSWCRDHLLHKGRRNRYMKHIVKLRQRATTKTWPSGRLSDAIENLHDSLRDADEEDTHAPRNRKGFSSTAEPVEQMHVFLDNSLSMRSVSGAAKQILEKIVPRLLRTPASLHFIGSNWEAHSPNKGWGICHRCVVDGETNTDGVGHCSECEPGQFEKVSVDVVAGPKSHKFFNKDDEFFLDDILPMWTMSSKYTYLWRYVLSVVLAEADQDHEVIIITDGYDNDSDGDFVGKKGFNAVMNHLKAAGRKLPRFVVRFFGEDKDNMYRDLALASGGAFMGGHSADADGKFVQYVKLSHAARARKALRQMYQYQKLLASGWASNFPWYDALPSPSDL